MLDQPQPQFSFHGKRTNHTVGSMQPRRKNSLTSKPKGQADYEIANKTPSSLDTFAPSTNPSMKQESPKKLASTLISFWTNQSKNASTASVASASVNDSFDEQSQQENRSIVGTHTKFISNEDSAEKDIETIRHSGKSIAFSGCPYNQRTKKALALSSQYDDSNNLTIADKRSQLQVPDVATCCPKPQTLKAGKDKLKEANVPSNVPNSRLASDCTTSVAERIAHLRNSLSSHANQKANMSTFFPRSNLAEKSDEVLSEDPNKLNSDINFKSIDVPDEKKHGNTTTVAATGSSTKLIESRKHHPYHETIRDRNSLPATHTAPKQNPVAAKNFKDTTIKSLDQFRLRGILRPTIDSETRKSIVSTISPLPSPKNSINSIDSDDTSVNSTNFGLVHSVANYKPLHGKTTTDATTTSIRNDSTFRVLSSTLTRKKSIYHKSSNDKRDSSQLLEQKTSLATSQSGPCVKQTEIDGLKRKVDEISILIETLMKSQQSIKVDILLLQKQQNDLQSQHIKKK